MTKIYYSIVFALVMSIIGIQVEKISFNKKISRIESDTNSKILITNNSKCIKMEGIDVVELPKEMISNQTVSEVSSYLKTICGK